MATPRPYYGRRFRFHFWNHELTLICQGTTERDNKLYLLFFGADGAARATFEIAAVRCTPDD